MRTVTEESADPDVGDLVTTGCQNFFAMACSFST
jgi:hypothetical protein